MIKPRQPAPALSVPLLGGGTWTLADQEPENFTMVVVYRGYHCPICSAYLGDLNRKAEQFAAKGVNLVVISSDTEKRAAEAKVRADEDRAREAELRAEREKIRAREEALAEEARKKGLAAEATAKTKKEREELAAAEERLREKKEAERKAEEAAAAAKPKAGKQAAKPAAKGKAAPAKKYVDSSDEEDIPLSKRTK